MKKTAKKILRIVLIILLVFALLLAGIVAFVQTGGGRNQLLKLLSNYGVKVSNIEGTIPSDMRIAHLEISDASGAWLTIDNLHLDWQPLALLKKQINVDHLTADRIHVLRLPQSNAESVPEKTGPFRLPSLPDIQLGELALPDITLELPVTGALRQFSVTGHSADTDTQITARTLQGPATTLDLALQTKNTLNAKLDLQEEPGGLISTLLKLPDGQTVAAHLDLQGAEQSVALNDLAVSVGSATIKGHAHYADTIDGAFDISLPDAGLFSAAAGQELSGAAAGHITLGGTRDNLQSDVQFSSEKMTLSGNVLADAALTAHFFSNLEAGQTAGTLNVAAQYNDAPVLFELTTTTPRAAVTDFTLSMQQGDYHINGTGSVDSTAQNFTTSLQLQPVKIEANEISAALNAKGGFTQFNIDGTVSVALPNGKAEFKTDGAIDVTQQTFDGALDGTLARADKTLTLAVPIKADADTIRASAIAIKSDGFALTGDAAWQLALSQADANLTLDARDLRTIGILFNLPLSGAADADIDLKSGEQGQQGAITASIKNLIFGTNKINSLTLDAKSNDNALSARADLNGALSDKPLALSLLLGGTRDENKLQATLQKFSGAFDGKPFALSNPLTIAQQGKRVTISPATLSIARGTVQVRGDIAPDKVDASITARGLALEELPGAGAMDGVVNAALNLYGTMQKPKAIVTTDGNLRAADLPLTFTLKSNWQNNLLTINGDANANGATAALDAKLPAQLSLSPFTIGLNDKTQIKGAVDINAPLQSFNPMLRASGVRMGGTFAGKAALAGTLGAPAINGRFNLVGGTIDHPDSGVCLRNVSATILGSNTQLSLQNLSAQNEGSLTSSARLSLAAPNELSGQIKFDDFRLFCGGMMSGLIDGALNAQGSLQDAAVTGNLKLGPLNVQLPGQTPGQVPIPQVKIVRVDARGRPLDKTGNGKANRVALDITLDAPNQIFVRGRGLDAEFGGKLQIAGDVTQPSFTGNFESIRGRFALLDRDMKLSRAAFRFNGPIPPSPFIDVVAETTVEDTTITATLSGNAAKPEFAFTSSPSRPKDEVLALLLFGRSLATLTPFQAIQLAQSVRELSGQSSGPGILDRVRNTVGVDRLDVGQDDEGGVNVGAGKYITDKVYVGVTQGAKPEDRSINTEVELTPQISGTNAIDSEGNQDVGVQWRYDY